jgi:hypothetical protein
MAKAHVGSREAVGQQRSLHSVSQPVRDQRTCHRQGVLRVPQVSAFARGTCLCLPRRGAFRRFKDVLHRHNLQQDWYAFRENALREIAIAFCEENNLAWK